MLRQRPAEPSLVILVRLQHELERKTRALLMNTLPHEPLGPLVLMLQLVQALQRVHTLQRIHNFPVELMAGQGTVAGMPKASGY